jgi:cell wall-associated NlpC family hydrolase
MPRMSFTSFARATRCALVIQTCAALCVPAAVRAQETKPFEAYSNSAHSLRDSVVALAKAQLGKRYRYGGKSPERGFDCSGLVQYIMAALNLDIPRTARQQANAGQEVERDTSRLLPGDLLTFAKPKKGVSHVGIYIGDGKFIQASSVAGRVVESSINRTPSRLVKAWLGARRFLAFDDSMSSAIAAPSDSGAPVNKGGTKH